ncbi:MAG: DUF2911 domain-containing protein [Acidobacteria bacterium]|nr:DUF2911 domain-containing protein [Acidobacteriota bacterium]
MRIRLAVAAVALLAGGVGVIAQQSTPARPLSPDGIASVQVLGKWEQADRQTYTMGGARYVGGKWIDILYGRPLLRGRDAFTGTGADYGKATNGPDAVVWRAGANFTTRLRSEVPLVIGGVTVPAGEHTLFIHLEQPTQWTFIVSNWPAQTKYDPNNKEALYGAFNYTPDKDVVRAPMKVETLPYRIEQLTWQFADMTPTGGRMAIMWDRSMGSLPFTVVAP